MKKLFVILPLVLIVCFMVGCQDKKAMAEIEEYRAQAREDFDRLGFMQQLGMELKPKEEK
jgi:hypothetical protein